MSREPGGSLLPINPNIDVPRLITDLNITDADREALETLSLLPAFIVPSTSHI